MKSVQLFRRSLVTNTTRGFYKLDITWANTANLLMPHSQKLSIQFKRYATDAADKYIETQNCYPWVKINEDFVLWIRTFALL